MSASHAVLTAGALFFAASCTGDSRTSRSPVTPTAPVTPPVPVSTAILIVSGDSQPAKAGEPLADPLVVRVTDLNGNGVNDVEVTFRLSSGAGVFGTFCDAPAPMTTRSARTNPDGIAEMIFRPTVIGRSTVTAQSPGAHGASVTFTAEATMLVIEFWFGYWNVGFVGPCSNSNDVTVPVGTPVEWKIPVEDDRYPITYTVTSTSTPPGGEAFASGMLTSKERFRFVPAVAGTWTYRDEVTGLTGTLTAR